MASVSWQYPHYQLIALQRRNTIAEEAVGQVVDSGLRIDSLQFRYAISGDNPSFPEPIRAALFEEDGAAYLVWNRREG